MGLPLLVWLLLLGAQALAGVARFAVIVGNNEGLPGTERLYFAESDAEKIQHLLTTLGGVPTQNTRLLLGRDRNTLLTEMGSGALRDDIAAARARGDDTLLIVYYSGHADQQQLHLGSTRVTWAELDALMERSGADVRVALLDACDSGAMTRAKGGQRAPAFVFDLSERLNAQGQVVITSSAANEASQESDEIGGGYFTHFLASALTGAADVDHDGRVTLYETYAYVHQETKFHTAGTRIGSQSPGYDWDLSGEGDLVLAELRPDEQATLVLPAGLEGRYAIFDMKRRQFVAEVATSGDEQRLTLPASAYLVQARYPTHLLSAQIDLRARGTVVVQPADFVATEYEDDQARGAIEKQIRRASLPRMALRMTLGSMRFSNPAIEAAYFPPIPLAGVSTRWHQQKRYERGERWLGLDVAGGTGSGTLTLDAWAAELPVRAHMTTLGASAGFATRRRLVQAGGGLRVSGLYLMREFPGQDLVNQDLLTLSPGLVSWVGLRPGRVEVDLEWRLQMFPYTLDDPDLTTSYSEGYLTFGYRF